MANYKLLDTFQATLQITDINSDGEEAYASLIVKRAFL